MQGKLRVFEQHLHLKTHWIHFYQKWPAWQLLEYVAVAAVFMCFNCCNFLPTLFLGCIIIITKIWILVIMILDTIALSMWNHYATSVLFWLACVTTTCWSMKWIAGYHDLLALPPQPLVPLPSPPPPPPFPTHHHLIFTPFPPPTHPHHHHLFPHTIPTINPLLTITSIGKRNHH